jgi:hypothetical protein
MKYFSVVGVVFFPPHLTAATWNDDVDLWNWIVSRFSDEWKIALRRLGKTQRVNRESFNLVL